MKLNIQITSIDTLGPASGSATVRARTWFGNPIAALLLTAFLLCGSIGMAHAQDANGVCRVSTTGSPGGNGADWAHSKDLISALYGCPEIWVAQGVYRTTQFVISFNIRANAQLYGGFAGNESNRSQRDWIIHPTVLSGDQGNDDINTDGNGIDETVSDIKGTNNNSQNVVRLGATPSTPINGNTVLDGFIITGGDGSKVGGTGGGLVCFGVGTGNNCSPTLRNLVFSGNAAAFGGAMYLNGEQGGKSSPEITNVVFTGNAVSNGSTQAHGGALYVDAKNAGVANPTLVNVIFTDNSAATNGGAMFSDAELNGISNPSLTDVTFDNNSAFYEGGAMMNFGFGGESSPSLLNVTFSHNSAISGGAMFNTGALDNAHPSFPGVSHPMLRNVTFSDNQASASGGAMYNYGQSNGDCSPTLNNVTISGNSANTGGAMYNTGYASGKTNTTMSNVILWGNTATSGQNIYINDDQFATTSLSISYSVVEDGDSGITYKMGRTSTAFLDGGFNYSTDPELGALADNGGFTLTMAPGPNGSAVDHGICAGAPSMDQRGVARPNGSACDIGAVEALPDVLFANGFEQP